MEKNDLLGLLWTKFLEHEREHNPHGGIAQGYDEGDPGVDVQAFLEFAREYLRGNQPVAMDYVETGFAVRLQDGTVVPFVCDPVASTDGLPGGVEFTRPDPRKDKGIDRRGSLAFGITGPEAARK